MEKIQMAFLDDSVRVKGEYYNDIQKVFNFITLQKNNAKKVSIKKEECDVCKTYTLKLDKDIIEAYFPIDDEGIYSQAMERWYENNKRQRNRRLKILAILLASGIAISKVLPHLDDIFDTCVETIDDCMDYLGNLRQSYDISNLEYELRAHSGHAEIEGRSQTIEEHKNSPCFLGKDVKISEMDEKILEYCVEHNLGIEVAQAASEKFNLLYNNNLEKANQIDLFDIYVNGIESQKQYIMVQK